jgi:signal transduction histidine kinase
VETLGQLTGGIAHDFNNVLCAILANVDFLIEGFDDADPRRVDAVEIRDAARRATDLASRLLQFSRRHVLDVKDIEVGDVVGSVSRMLRRLIGAGIELVIDKCEDSTVVHADGLQLEQVLVNLVLNARDAMPDGGKLTITTRQTSMTQGNSVPAGPYVVLSVKDTGCGMSIETQRRLFEPFYTTKPSGRGTGLGLATCFGVVRQLGGDIRVTSEIDRGTTMDVYLPQVRRVDCRPHTTSRLRRPQHLMWLQ